ncbi:DUF808 domain-containing protein [Sphingomicrobium aestuariivivum]|uniref:DUF808 domain-containing protein n=1 Tax=Sphingomicrobium aestuariivivum TaxID=1582356 RepID=UPI001FD69A4A|nr:DUF808 domain-containing protein [Sphingomicrobium aestuariivivum]MCJ8191313.1 DUF808 domain-containing protein [Sphingomicrobium aestuariivivum]
MPSGLVALLDDVALIARTAAASVDDVAAAAGKAGTKTAGVIIDDAAVTPRYVTGLDPSRELPIIGKITLGSLKNKLIFLLPAALLLSEFAPFLIIPILMLGGGFLAFEATEKIIEAITGDHHGEATLAATDTPEELEKRQVSGAVRTDFILSAEIMAITLNELTAGGMVDNIWMRAGALAIVAVAVTVIVYGSVAIIVKLDDIGLHLAKRENGFARKFGRALIAFVPKLLKALSIIGTAAMLWVGGSILLHGFHELHVLGFLYEWNHDAAVAVAGDNGVGVWIMETLGAALTGLVFGFIIVQVVTRLFGHHPLHGGGEPVKDTH